MAQPAVKKMATLEEKALSFPDRAKQLTINSPDDYVSAGEFIVGINALVKEIETSFNPQIDSAHKLHRSLIAERDRHLKPLNDAKKMAKALMVNWDRKQDEIRKAEEARLREEARKREEEAKLAAALEAEAAGQKEEAQAILEEEVYVPPVVVQKETPRVQGVQFRSIWRFRIVDPNKLPREFMVPDEVKIGQVVRAMKSMTKIPGVEAYEDRV